LLTGLNGTLVRIAVDGALLISNGDTVTSYASTGALKWSVSYGRVPDVALAVDGTVYVSTGGSIFALNKDTGAPLWPAPYVASSGGESAALAVLKSGTILFHSGYPEKLAAINPDGTEKWAIGDNFRGYSSVVLSTDESVAYFLDLSGYSSWERGVSTATGQDVYGATFLPRSNTQAFAPWGMLYMPGSNGYSDFLLGCTMTLSCSSIVGGDYGVTALLPAGIIVAARSSDGKTVGLNQVGAPLWVVADPLGPVISDSNNIIYASIPSTNAVAAIDGTTGAELWRQTFSGPASSILLGDDGSLYVQVGGTVYKAAPNRHPVILIHGWCSSTLGFGNLESLLTGKGFHVHSFDYSFYSDFSIENIAYRFAQFVQGVKTTENATQVDVVAHSEGGLITRAWMAGLAAGPSAVLYTGQILRLATIGTPHYGVPIDVSSFNNNYWQTFTALAGDCSRLQGEEMFYGSAFISQLHDQWSVLQNSSLALSDQNQLFISGTHSDNCDGLPDSVYAEGTPPCNDGLVDIDSAVLPSAPASQVRYVPYKHCNNCGIGTAEAFVTDETHKTYQLLSSWLMTGVIPSQNAIGYIPSFLSDPTKYRGFLLLRFQDMDGAHKAPKIKSASVSSPVQPSFFVNGNDTTSALTITNISAGTYTIAVEFDGYKTQLLQGTVTNDRPTVPAVVLVEHK
jgi:outer membrane protein assembly factor BamB